VIQGQLTLGALVAVIGAHKELYSPWKELLSHYQLTWDSQIKFEQVVAQFDPAGVRDEALQAADPIEGVRLVGQLRAANLMLVSEDGQVILDGASFAVDLPARIAILGPAGSGKEELTLILATLLEPDAGRVMIDGHDLHKLPEAVTGRQMTFVGYPAYVFAGTIADNLLFGLRHRPLQPRELEGAAAEEYERNLLEAQRSGNSPFDSEADWIDYEAAGLSGPEEVVPAAVRALAMVRLERDVYHMGLRGTIDPDARPEVAAAILQARRAMRARLEDPRFSRLVEVFDVERYNTNATLAENLLFGAPVDETFAIDRLAAHPYVQQTLERAGLTDTLVEVGLKVAATMVELFADLPPDHEYFRQFSFISADDLPEYRALTTRADPTRLDRLGLEDRQRLIALTFKLALARHRLELVDEALQARILEARRLFREHLPPELAGSVAFFDAERYTASASLQDNILFGKIAYGQAQATERIGELIAEVLNELGLHERVVEVGLQAQTGVGGGRLSLAQRQKLALARAILKRPEILVLYEATGPLDPTEQQAIMAALLEEFAERTLIWAVTHSESAASFDHVLIMRNGRMVAQGRYDELNRDGTALHELIAAE
jgi:putative ABC transport system ATP-binding protein